MLTVTASLFKRDFGEFQRQVRHEPIQVMNDGQTAGYFVSPEDFAEFQQLKAAAMRRHLRPGDLSDAHLDALRSARVPPEHAHLDALMDD